MTTKQEIIDYIQRNIIYYYDEEDGFYGNEDECNKLIQMIKDLKPRVKKLPWAKVEDGYYAYDYKLILDHDGYVSYFISSGDSISHGDTLEEAQEACQKHYEETILGALEDYN